MAENLLIEECPAEVSEDVKAYWQKKLPRIERLLQPIPEDLRQLRFHFECDKSRYEAWAILSLPSGTLVAHSDPAYHDVHEAVDQVADRLAMEIRREKEYVRRDYVYRRRIRRRRDFMALLPRLALLRRKEDQKGFVELLRPHLRQMKDHARRELIIAQLEGNVHPGEMTVQDLLDETVIRAWDEWHQRPRDEPLDRWLVGLLHDVLDEKGLKTPGGGADRKSKASTEATNEPVSIYERVRADDPRFDAEDGDLIEANPAWPFAAENEWAAENNPYWPFLNPLTRDETLPDEQSAEPWQELANDEIRRVILDELKRFPRKQRRAFTLHVLDGWTIDEIASSQGRSTDEVNADIEAMRSALRQRLEKAAA
jgi:DNA-directed RNA polymerase specialized sigma24 family protein/ribosome-associated translation inhibitor RaiA